jgi:KUP system potassium uptake protein
VAVGGGYNFLRQNCRGPAVVLRVSPASLLVMGMVYVL